MSKEKLKKRHFYNYKDYIIDDERKILILNKEFHEKLLSKNLWNKFGFKKIGGSSIGEILLVDSFKSQFAAFAKISWLGMPILDDKYVKAGQAIEPKVVAALENKLGYKIQTFDPMKYEYDYFKGKDELIGGIPDGYIPEKEIIIEIKTTGEKNYDSWEKFGIPVSYLKQGQLYAYLMGVKKFVIVATFLKDEDYLNPENYPIQQRKMKSYAYDVNIEQVEDDIERAKTWYKNFTLMGMSPQYDPKLDGELLEYLRCENEEQWLALLDKWEAEGKLGNGK